jgi:hypothetical protein
MDPDAHEEISMADLPERRRNAQGRLPHRHPQRGGGQRALGILKPQDFLQR